jgi:uncharacterized ferritin-like protein (DUF455 family)
MELSEFARKILLSESLSEKMTEVGVLTDLRPYEFEGLPSKPARSEKLSLDRWKTASKVSFPSRSELLDPQHVAVLLHFFANHELLALELMALALLKFPEAPSAFRLGVAHTMRDEQRHLRSYLRRMNDFGLDFGDIPLNDFFWSQCSTMASPMDYVCRMSLTFEQANIDFAAFFRDLLADLGDSETAALMQQVLSDELKHVKHGLDWFKRWKHENVSDWQAFCFALGAEINPSRAKGQILRVDYRQSIGFSDDYINSLRVYSRSKGRLPRVMFFNPEAEEEVRLGGSQMPHLAERLLSARDDLAPVMLFAASPTDLVLVAHDLPLPFLLQLRDCGFDLPEVQTTSLTEKKLIELLRSRKCSSVYAWAVSPAVLRLERDLGLSDDSCFQGSPQALRGMYSKVTAFAFMKEILGDPALFQTAVADEKLVEVQSVGRLVHQPSDFDKFILESIVHNSHAEFVAKRPWSASGRHRFFGALADGCWEQQPDAVRRWFQKSWRVGEEPIVQPYFKRVMDLSIQGRIDSNANLNSPDVHVLGFTRVLNNPRGQYVGSCVGRYLSGCDSRFMKFFHQNFEFQGQTVEGVEGYMELLAVWTGKKLFERGLRGPYGIDAFVYEDHLGQLRLYPMIEINPRHTMGRIALGLGRRMMPGRVGVWLHVPRTWLQELAVTNFVELRERWKAILPLQTYSRSGGIVIRHGLLETTPAENCQHVWTCFLVGDNLENQLHQLGITHLLDISPKVLVDN